MSIDGGMISSRELYSDLARLYTVDHAREATAPDLWTRIIVGPAYRAPTATISIRANQACSRIN